MMIHGMFPLLIYNRRKLKYHFYEKTRQPMIVLKVKWINLFVIMITTLITVIYRVFFRLKNSFAILL